MIDLSTIDIEAFHKDFDAWFNLNQRHRTNNNATDAGAWVHSPFNRQAINDDETEALLMIARSLHLTPKYALDRLMGSYVPADAWFSKGFYGGP